ncbi:MAG: recombinase family protein [Litorimonas sp.]
MTTRKPKTIGYARVSREDMNENRQTNELNKICDKVFIEKLSAVAKKRPKFDQAIEGLREGDSLVVLDLDRAFRSTIDALLTAELLRERGVNLRILSLNLDLSTEYGELIFAVFSAFAQFERRILSRRTKEGLRAAVRRGVKLGRPSKSNRCRSL